MKIKTQIYLLSGILFLIFCISIPKVFASITATDNIDGTVSILSSDVSPFFVCYDAVYNIPDDNLHSSAGASSNNPYVLTNANVFQSPGNLIVNGVAGDYTCFSYNGSNMPPWPTSNKVYQNADEWVEFYWDGNNIIEPVIDTSTHIISVTPENETATTSTTTTINANWYINTTDLEMLSDGILGIGKGNIRITAQLCPLNKIPATTCFPVIDTTITKAEGYTIDEITSTTTTQNNTDYKMVWGITGYNYANFFGPVFNTSTTTYFTVGSTTNSGRIKEHEDFILGQYNRTASTTDDVYAVINSACNPFSTGDFDVGLCIYSIIAPPQDILARDIDILKEQFLYVAPIGYLTRFIDIMATTSTSSLPVIAYTTSGNSMFGTTTFEFNPFGALASADSPLTYTSDQEEPKTMGQIFSYIINIIIYLTLFFMIIKHLTGVHLHGDFSATPSQNQKGNEAYRLKEALYKTSYRGRGGYGPFRKGRSD